MHAGYFRVSAIAAGLNGLSRTDGLDYRIFIVRAWWSACVHTLDLGLESHPKDLADQPQFWVPVLKDWKSPHMYAFPRSCLRSSSIESKSFCA